MTTEKTIDEDSRRALRPTDDLLEFFGQECVVQFREPLLLCKYSSQPSRLVPVLSLLGVPRPKAPENEHVMMQQNWPITQQLNPDGAPLFVVTLNNAVIMPSRTRGRVIVMYNVDGATMQMSVAVQDIVCVTKVGFAEEPSSLVRPGI